VWWALTVGGAGGVAGLMSYFQNELLSTMLHCGADKLAALGRGHVQLADRRQAVR
jgi:isopentenyl diphosphate isomerase/L-lactate dehydrogenase-like FMN-dependent dehydrogenase